MNSILVTGGAGYIGSVMVPYLLENNYRVTVIDNFMYNQASLLDCCYHNQLKVIRGDVRDRELLKEALKTADFILPFACLVGAPLCLKRPSEAEAVNRDAIEDILRLRSRSQRIIFPTTNSGYGIGQDDVYCTEETPLCPISLYGKLKVEAEKILLNSGNVITLRLATVFGISPRMRLDLLVNDFVYRAVRDNYIVLFESHFKRNYIHIRDVARAVLHCINNFNSMKDEPYNLGLSDANLSKLELCQEIRRHITTLQIMESSVGRDPDKRNYIVSNAKIERTGFKPQFSLSAGIAELIKGYQIIRNNSFTNV
ncbi:MAG: NAD(P)-dependent oxidoreductase [Candidatus Omnitrophica bacterium]|nr:NAD(P)-dependent oxidoreductase [Candidatus Omnitrophota bacterium]